jgi:hypothetical protein
VPEARAAGHPDASAAHPCRLFVFLARDAPLGLVLRRGPSDWFRLSLWHTDTDRLEHGQWLAGRVYERRSDLAPDGSLFVSFVRKSGGPPSSDPPAADSWVAISRPPYFTALALWFVGGTYWVGGFFPPPAPPSAPGTPGDAPDAARPRARSVFIGGGSGPPSQGALPSWLTVTRELPFVGPAHNSGHQLIPHQASDRLVFHNRLLRDGWVRRERPQGERPDQGAWERRQPGGEWTLFLEETGWDARAYGGPYVVRYAVSAKGHDEVVPLVDASWADWDRRGRLVVARRGRLLAGQPGDPLREIADFNGQAPEPAPAPAWARTWP